MSDDVVAGALEVLVDLRVEAVVRRLAQVSLFQEVDEGRGGLLDEEQRGRFERFDEALRQSHGKTILVPVLGDASDLHLQVPRRRIRVEQSKVFAQLPFCRIRRAKLRAVDVAVAKALRQRNFPGPAIFQGGGAGFRGQRIANRRRHGSPRR